MQNSLKRLYRPIIVYANNNNNKNMKNVLKLKNYDIVMLRNFTSQKQNEKHEVNESKNQNAENETKEITSQYNKDYSYNPTVISLNEEDHPDGYKANTDINIQLKDNPLAYKILKEGQIDIKDPRIQMNSLDISDASLLNPTEADQIKQINLGDVTVIPKNSVLLEDLDINNIPDDKDVIIDKKEKVLYAIGRKLEGRKSLEIINEDSSSNSTSTTTSNTTTNEATIHKIGKNIFEEKTLEEYKKENLFFHEQELLVFNYREFFRRTIALLPLAILFSNFLGSLFEYHIVKLDDFLIEEQEMRYLMDLRKKYANEILLKNPLFQRNLYVD